MKLLSLFCFLLFIIPVQFLSGQVDSTGVIVIYTVPDEVVINLPDLKIEINKTSPDPVIIKKVNPGLIKFVFSHESLKKLKAEDHLQANDTLTVLADLRKKTYTAALSEELKLLVDKTIEERLISESIKNAAQNVSQEQVKNDMDNNESEFDDEEVYYIVEEMPSFNGGDPSNEFRRYIAMNLRYPDEAASKGQSGRIIVQFMVDSQGIVRNAVVVSAPRNAPELEKEAIRVVLSSPPWTPGRQRGINVNVLFTFPINFNLQ